MMIRRNEAKDQVRATLIHEVGDERIKYIIEKYVVKPAMTQKKENVSSDMEKTLKLVTSFIGSYFEALQSNIQRMKEQQIIDSLKS